MFFQAQREWHENAIWRRAGIADANRFIKKFTTSKDDIRVSVSDRGKVAEIVGALTAHRTREVKLHLTNEGKQASERQEIFLKTAENLRNRKARVLHDVMYRVIDEVRP